jgi:hypothetical protein
MISLSYGAGMAQIVLLEQEIYIYIREVLHILYKILHTISKLIELLIGMELGYV